MDGDEVPESRCDCFTVGLTNVKILILIADFGFLASDPVYKNE